METPTLVGLLLVLLTILNVQPKIMLSVAAAESHSDDYLKFVHNATDLSLEAEYDYIIVGGGTAGCPLAATLSTSYSVLVLERGGTPQETPDVFTTEGFLNIHSVKDDGTYSPATDQFTSEDGVPNARGIILGGSSMVNIGFYSRAEDDFYEKSGIEWDMGVVEEAYSWAEETVAFQPDLKVWQTAARKAMVESGAVPDNGFTFNHIIGTKTGGSIFDTSGRRHGAVELLNNAVPNNLQVAVHATVEKIIFSNSNSSGLTAVGVIYSDSNGKSHQAMVRNKGEVILSAGALGSTQLLLLSGVGPQPYLSSLKIPIVHHQPHVGQFFVDNPRNGIAIVPPFPLETSLVEVVGITTYGAYIEPASYNVPYYSRVRSGIFPSPTSPTYFPVAILPEKIGRPLSVGSLKLASSTDVRITPKVRFNYFENQEDLNTCVSGMRKIGEMLRSPSMDRFKSEDLNTGARNFRFIGLSLPINQSDDASMETFCRNTVATIWHYHGGCTVGKVVDGDFKVMGINALRVIDGSIFILSPGTNPQSTLMMLGRYSGLKILQKRKTGN